MNRDAGANLISAPKWASCPQGALESGTGLQPAYRYAPAGACPPAVVGMFSAAPRLSGVDVRRDGRPRPPAAKAGGETKYPVFKGSSSNPGNGNKDKWGV